MVPSSTAQDRPLTPLCRSLTSILSARAPFYNEGDENKAQPPKP